MMGCQVPFGEPVTNLISLLQILSQVSGEGDGVVMLPLGKYHKCYGITKQIEWNYGLKRLGEDHS